MDQLDIKLELTEAGFTDTEIEGILLDAAIDGVESYDLVVERSIYTYLKASLNFGPVEEIQVKGNFIMRITWKDGEQCVEPIARLTAELELKLELFRINRRRRVLIEKLGI